MTHDQFIEAVSNNNMHLSFSSLTAFMRSPRHFYHYHTKDKERTDAMLLGDLTHVLILQPEKLAEKFAIKPQNANKASNANKEILARFEADNVGKIAISADQWELAKQMAEAVTKNPTISPLLIGAKEQPFTVEYNGIKLKGIRDVYNDFAGTTDLKTTAEAHPKKFARKAVWDFFYYLQARIYTLSDETSYTLVVVDTNCYTSVIDFDRTAIEAGGLLLDKLVRNYKKLQEQTAAALNVWNQGYEFWYPDGYTISM